MTDSTTENKVRNRFPDRLTVDPANLEKVGRILEQLRSEVQGCDVSRKDILNWIIEKCPDHLNAADLKDLSERFYDEERFLRFALEQVRAAKLRGEHLTIGDILQKKGLGNVAAPKKSRRRKTLKTEEGTEPIEAHPVDRLDPEDATGLFEIKEAKALK